MWLGHADAIDSVPGKLGSEQQSVAGGRTNDQSALAPVAKALRDKQSKDAQFVTPVVNDSVIPRLRALGIDIPHGHHFKFLNDAEEREVQEQDVRQKQAMATLAKTMADAGLRMSAEYFKEQTGIGVNHQTS